MWKRILSLSLAIVLTLSVSAQAAMMVLYGTPKLSISGTTATCSVTVESSSDDELKIILTLWCGESIVDSWSETGVGEVSIKETCKVVEGNYYELVMMPIVNGEALEPVTVSAHS